jgi:RimJ/RimL family protein N-acetyltransferase
MRLASMDDVDTERLRLARWRHREHAAGLADANAEAAVMRYLNGGTPLTRAESDAVSRRVQAHWETHGFGLWAAVERATGRMIGFVGVCHPTWFPAWAHTVEVGWRLHPDAWGRGLATEAARQALRSGFERRGLEEIVAFVHPENRRSEAVTARLGMKRSEQVAHPDHGHAMNVFRIRREDRG